MTKRIFRSIFLVALVVLLLSVALLSVVFYNDYAVQYRSELKSEALSMAHAINGRPCGGGLPALAGAG